MRWNHTFLPMYCRGPVIKIIQINKIMPKVSRQRLSLFRLEEKLCINLRISHDWALKNDILENLTRFQSNVSPRSRIITNIFNPKQYKILGVSAPFLSPFVVTYKKKVAHVMYRFNVVKPPDPVAVTNALLPLFTCFPLWEYLLAHPYQVTSISIAQLHLLFPQWSVDDWTQFVEKVDHMFKQINDANALRAEMKRISSTESSHYPWWKDEDPIRTAHEEIDSKLKHLEYSQPSDQKQTTITSKPPTGHLYLSLPQLSLEDHTELLSLSQHLYDYFRQQISMADIQYQAWQCRLNHDQTKASVEQCKPPKTIHEQFPNQYEQIRTHFQHRTPKLSNEHLFQIWQQSRGNWDIIRLI